MLNESKVEEVLTALSLECTKPTEITICGGASMVLNYNTRNSTRDIDCFRLENKLKDDAVRIAKSLGLNYDWINDNVCVTKSYNDNLIKYRTLYKEYGLLKVYTIKGMPLLCMKLVSFREHSSDTEDCRNLIKCLKSKYCTQDVRDMIYDIYHDSSVLSVDAEVFLVKEFEGSSFDLDEESLTSYCDMINDGLLSIDDVPKEFVNQIAARLTNEAKSGLDSSIERLLKLGG